VDCKEAGAAGLRLREVDNSFFGGGKDVHRVQLVVKPALFALRWSGCEIKLEEETSIGLAS